MQASHIRIGTRGSPLALAQAREVEARLAAAHGARAPSFEIKIFKTSGDRIQDRLLSEAGGKGLFTKELEEALIAGEIDIAVHSMKDMPTVLPEGLAIRAILPREDVRDAFISRAAASLMELAPGAVVATASLRRQAQVRHLRSDLKVTGLRGNVETRLRKLEEGVADATLLACAGLNRLGLASRITSIIATDEMLPACAQGAVGVEMREGDAEVGMLIAAINHQPSALAVEIERAFLRRLDGSCRTPIAGLAELGDGEVRFRGMILKPDGSVAHEIDLRTPPHAGVKAAVEAAEELLGRAGPDFLAG
ncbi:MAG: hydroxymethylbilane synthase [Hyphomicrobiaceae bacterium]|nr:hydroxymethylbilane synthase [Hyphomicrobiaceae bacterium]